MDETETDWRREYRFSEGGVGDHRDDDKLRKE